MHFQVFTRDSRTHRAVRTDGKFEGFVILSEGLGVVIDIPDTENGSRVTADLARLRSQGLVVLEAE